MPQLPVAQPLTTGVCMWGLGLGWSLECPHNWRRLLKNSNCGYILKSVYEAVYGASCVYFVPWHPFWSCSLPVYNLAKIQLSLSISPFRVEQSIRRDLDWTH